MKRDREKEGSGLVTNWEWRLRGNVECSAKSDIAFGASETKGGNKIFEGMGVACTRFFREKKKKGNFSSSWANTDIKNVFLRYYMKFRGEKKIMESESVSF